MIHVVGDLCATGKGERNFPVSDFIKYIGNIKFDRGYIITTEPEKTSRTEEIGSIVDSYPSIGVHRVEISEYSSRLNNSKAEMEKSPEGLVKLNIIDMIDSSITKYLSSYWKNPEGVNSELTDSVFKAKHTLVSEFFYDLEKLLWIEPNKQILDFLNRQGTGYNVLAIVDPERKYWLVSKL
ncbi:MAG: hypothetical protein ACP5NK_01615 [Thermoplasmata archaeon]